MFRVCGGGGGGACALYLTILFALEHSRIPASTRRRSPRHSNRHSSIYQSNLFLLPFLIFLFILPSPPPRPHLLVFHSHLARRRSRNNRWTRAPRNDSVPLPSSSALGWRSGGQLYIILIRPERNVRQSMMPVRYSAMNKTPGTGPSSMMAAIMVTAATCNQNEKIEKQTSVFAPEDGNKLRVKNIGKNNYCFIEFQFRVFFFPIFSLSFLFPCPSFAATSFAAHIFFMFGHYLAVSLPLRFPRIFKWSELSSIALNKIINLIMESN